MDEETPDKESLDKETPATEVPTDRVVFHFIKSGFFRVVYANGVLGGVSPKGEIQMAFFNERIAFPQQIAHTIEQSGKGLTLGAEIPAYKVSKEGIVREVETQVIMTLQTANAVHKWLGEQLKNYENLISHGHIAPSS